MLRAAASAAVFSTAVDARFASGAVAAVELVVGLIAAMGAVAGDYEFVAGETAVVARG